MKSIFNTRTGGGSENHTVWGGEHIMPPLIDLSSYESQRNEFRGLSGAILEHFRAKILGPWVNPFKVKRVKFQKCLPF